MECRGEGSRDALQKHTLKFQLSFDIQGLEARQTETAKIDKYLITKFFPGEVCDSGNGIYHLFVPYGGDVYDKVSLNITKVLDPDAWEAAQDWNRESVTDLPPESWRADVDQPAREILELGKRMLADIGALETATLRRETQKMNEALERIKLQIRGAEALVRVQREAINSDD